LRSAVCGIDEVDVFGRTPRCVNGKDGEGMFENLQWRDVTVEVSAVLVRVVGFVGKSGRELNFFSNKSFSL